MKMASSNEVVDPERKFQEDLAKAQALSLESLALETYQRQRKFRSSATKTNEVSLKNQQTKPGSSITSSRPGSFRSQRVPKLAPPPTVQRRNSAAASVCTGNTEVESSVSDLISFSPSPTEKKGSFQNFETENNSSDWTSNVRTKLDFANTSASTITSISNANKPFSSSHHHTTTPAYHQYALSSYLGYGPGNNNYGSAYRPNSSVPKPPDFQYLFKHSEHVVQNTLSPSSTSALAKEIMESDFLKVLTIEENDKSNVNDLMTFEKSSEDSKSKESKIVSLLEAFDPLMIKIPPVIETPVETAQIKRPHLELEGVSANISCSGEADDDSECSFYNPYDPFDLSAPGEVESPIYATVNKKPKAADTPPPPLPPRPSAWSTLEKRRGTIEGKQKYQSRLYENIQVVQRRAALHDIDLQEFHVMVKLLRGKYISSDLDTNVGLVISPLIDSPYIEGTNIKLVVYSKPDINPVTFVCDVSTTIQHVILHVVCELEGDLTGEARDYFLKVWGLAEFFSMDTCLADYEHIHQCLKLEEDVVLNIIHSSMLQRPLARTPLDDDRDSELTLENLLPNEPAQPISYDTLRILLETVESEMEKVLVQATEVTRSSPRSRIQVKMVVQAVKVICALMGNIETQDITEAVGALQSACRNPVENASERWVRPEIIAEDGDFSMVTLRPHSSNDSLPSNVAIQMDRIRDAIQSLIETYCQAFRVDFHLSSKAELPSTSRLSCDILDTVVLHVGCLHRLLQGWQQDEFFLTAQIFHGTQPVGLQVISSPAKKTTSFFDRVRFDVVLNFPTVSVCMLPLEARVVLVVYGQTVLPAESGDEEPQIQKQELAWAAIQFFSYQGMLMQGSFLLSCWPPVADKRLGPAPAPGTHPHGHNDPVLWVELPDYGGSRIVFPPKKDSRQKLQKHDFNSLDHNTQQQLLTIVEQDPFTRPPMDEREVLWEKRHYLHGHPQALPKVLLAAHSWDWGCLGDLHSMLHSWTPMEPVNALQLLLPCFPDLEVRRKAVEWISHLSSDELVDYLPQLVQALKHQTFETSPLAEFLLERALCSPRVAHHLYWLLMQTLPGQCPQNSSELPGEDDLSLSEARYHRRLQLMLRALLGISGEALQGRFLSQQLLVKNMYEIAESVKSTKESLRLKVLAQELAVLHHTLEEAPTCLPLSPSLEVAGVQVRTSSYFPSNTLPLKINFLSSETGIIPAIFKVGDDLQQDMLTIQMVRIMDKLWLKEGLDLKMVTFSCVPTGVKRGMIEMVSNAETLRKIQVELGLTGSFKDRPIAEWLAKHNPAAYEYERAVGNFTASCAGYSVATYILGICDRHNDNIMLKTSGHLFHIDFGKFLGDAQMFGNFKRDRTPFVLTSDMAYVINGGERPTAKFHHFVDLCCQAFNIVRKHGNLLLNLFGLMASAGIPGVTMDAVCYVQRALLPGRSNAEAAATFTRMIESSLKSWFTQFNFFLHNIAQLRFTGDHNDGELLSFIPRTYTMLQEGRIHSVCVHGYQKRYDPEKYYVYILRVERANQPDPVYLFRSYKEFCELHQKLCILFPLAKCHSLPTGRSMGRSNIKQVAERRRADIEQFLHSLFQMADEISHSDIVYTFFHPLLRDQQEANIHALKVKEMRPALPSSSESRRLCGQLKLSLHYSRDVLTVMIHHARGLPLVAAGNEPSPYVKVYLLPDPDKRTKRKTKVVKRNCHPTFMEMLEYRHMSEEVARCRILQATVWNHDTLQENEFLGGFNLPLRTVDFTQETVEWYSLGNVNRA